MFDVPKPEQQQRGIPKKGAAPSGKTTAAAINDLALPQKYKPTFEHVMTEHIFKAFPELEAFSKKVDIKWDYDALSDESMRHKVNGPKSYTLTFGNAFREEAEMIYYALHGIKHCQREFEHRASKDSSAEEKATISESLPVLRKIIAQMSTSLDLSVIRTNENLKIIYDSAERLSK